MRVETVGPRSERGVALMAALMLVALLTALGAALAMVATTEARVAAGYRDGLEAFHAAEGAVERILPELLATGDWNGVLGGEVRSTFVDGAPTGSRDLGGGTRLDLARATNLARCGQVTACTESDMNAVTESRPWGLNNPRWQLHAYGPAARLLAPGEIDSRVYVVVWVGDDPSEVDGDPLKDGTAGTSPGHEVLVVRAEAFAPGGVHRTVEMTIGRTPDALRVLSWRAP